MQIGVSHCQVKYQTVTHLAFCTAIKAESRLAVNPPIEKNTYSTERERLNVPHHQLQTLTATKLVDI